MLNTKLDKINNKINIIYILLGAFSLFLGMANPFVQVPMLIIFYPAFLYLLGFHAKDKKQAFKLGATTGWLGGALSIYWIVIAVVSYGGLSIVVALACLFLLSLWFALWAGFFSLVVNILRLQSLYRRIFSLALFWFLIEYLKDYFLSGFPWLSLAQGAASYPILIQSSAFIGAYGLSALLALLGILFVEALENKKIFILVGAIFIGMLGLGYFRLSDNSLVENSQEKLEIALIQGNIGQEQKWSQENQTKSLKKYLQISEASLEAKPQLLVYPETAVPFFYQENGELSFMLRDFARENQVAIFFGAPAYVRDHSTRGYSSYNRAYLIDAKGQDVAYYDKEHLVPFGEYLPPIPFIHFLEPLLQGLGSFTKGTNASLPRLESDNVVVGVQICYEGIFTELAYKSVLMGANIFINISNDAWYGRSSAAAQHLDLSLLRSVEQGRYMARATNTGVSAFVDPYGRILQTSSLFEDEYLVDQVGLISSKTVYFYLYPYLMPIVLFFFILLNLNVLRKKLNKG